jgi:hypothetical protein
MMNLLQIQRGTATRGIATMTTTRLKSRQKNELSKTSKPIDIEFRSLKMARYAFLLALQKPHGADFDDIASNSTDPQVHEDNA